MFFYPYFRAPEKAFARILHASPDAPAVDIYFNDKIVGKNLAYRQFTPYFSLAPGLYNIRIYPAGKTTNPVINTSYNFIPNTIQTIAAADRLANIKLLHFEEPKLPQIPNKSYIRFAHLSPNAPAVDVTLPNGNVLFKNVGFTKATSYLPINAGTYTFQLRPTGTSDIILTVPNVSIRPGRYYTLYAIGLLNERPPLQMLIPLDGNSYIET